MERRARFTGRRDDTGEALPYTLALLAAGITPEIIFIFGFRFGDLAVLLTREPQQLLGFDAVLVLRILQNFREEPDCGTGIIALQRRPSFVHRSGSHPQIRLGNRTGGSIAGLNCCAGVRTMLAGRRGCRGRGCGKDRPACLRRPCSGNRNHNTPGLGVRGDLIGHRMIETNPEHKLVRTPGLDIDGVDAGLPAVRHGNVLMQQWCQGSGSRLVAIGRRHPDPQLIASLQRKMAGIANADVEIDLENCTIRLHRKLHAGQYPIGDGLGNRRPQRQQRHCRNRECWKPTRSDSSHHHPPPMAR